MKRKQSIFLFTICIISILVLSSNGIANSLSTKDVSDVPASSSVEWSDDFSDGNLDGWTVLQGSFRTPVAPRYTLQAGVSGLNIIHHPSTQVVGTWFWEMYEDFSRGSTLQVIFMAIGETIEEFEGYSIRLWYNEDAYGISFNRWNYTEGIDHSARWILSIYTIWETGSLIADDAWHRYNVTRTDNGTMYVLRDEELIVESTLDTLEYEFDSVLNVSDKFVVMEEYEAAIDTIVVGTDLPPITTPVITTSTTSTTTTTTSTTTSTGTTSTTTTGPTTPTGLPDILSSYLPIIGLCGVGIVVIIFIVLLKKK